MNIFNAITILATTPLRCVGQLGKDLSTLNPNNLKADESDGMLALFTLGGSSALKAVVKSLEDVGKELEN